MRGLKRNQKNRYFHYQKEILNAISEPAAFIDKKCRFVFINSAFNKFYNLETKDIIGKTVSIIWKDTVFGKQILSGINKCMKGDAVTVQFDGIIPGVEFKILEINYYPHLDSTGNVDGVIYASKDITEQKKTEQSLKENETRLKELNATKDKLFSIIGHDLQGPLSNIIGFSELIDKSYELYTSEEIRKYNKIIFELSQSVSETLENLLTWSRSQRNQITKTVRNVSMLLIIDKCYNLLFQNFAQKQIQFNNTITPDTLVFADEEMISIVVRNLISNAIKFTHRGGTITVFTSQTDGMVIFGVKDTGIGIPEDKLGNVFTASSTHSVKGTEGESGTGLGLIICKDFVEKNGGEIWLTSTPGEGSVFYFSLPAAVDIPAEIEKTGQIPY